MRLTLPTRQYGFTLIELMIVLVISAIVLAWGVPSFQTAIRNNRLTAETNRIIADLQLARSEAIKRGMRVNICRTTTAISTSACGQGGVAQYQYELGWLVYTSSTRDTSYSSSTDTLLRVGETGATDITIRSSASANTWLSLKANGMVDESNDGASYTLCYKGASTNQVPGRRVELSRTGRAKVCLDPSVTVTSSSLPKCDTAITFSCDGGGDAN